MEADQGLLRAGFERNENGNSDPISFRPTTIIYKRILCDNVRVL
jgi:hypothetical protein